jgi:hypothetical protein
MDELTINFEGYWQCRQATDPDPSEDPRGVSGYTYAIGDESDLDLIIRLQTDEIDPPQDFRLRNLPEYYPPQLVEAATGKKSLKEFLAPVKDASELPEKERELFGIYVTSVKLNGNTYDKGENALKGGKVRWLPEGVQRQPDGTSIGPKYELRNEITYHKRDGIIMPIVPFEIKIEAKDKKSSFQRFDPLDLDNHKKQIWQLPLDKYTRRNPQNFFNASAEVMEAQGFSSTSDPSSQFNAYFQKRKEWLQLQLSMTTDPVQIAAFKQRLFALEFFTENRRLEGKLGLQAIWDFTLNGKYELDGIEAELGKDIDTDSPWPITFWMGAFDGDVMRGYMRGSLTLPLK